MLDYGISMLWNWGCVTIGIGVVVGIAVRRLGVAGRVVTAAVMVALEK